MNCTEYLDQLHDYFLGKLALVRMDELDAHAAGCASCGALMRRARELSCREFTAFLNAYIDGELAPERRAIFERHLEICVDCANYLQSYRATTKLSVLALGSSSQLVPGAVPEELILAIVRAAPTRGEARGGAADS